MTGLGSLAVQMKNYEWQIDPTLPRKTWAVIRLDGKAFHTYTKKLDRPFDRKFLSDMASTMTYLCENIDGAQFGYTQSDEISIVLSDLATENTQMWFGGSVQKIVSVSASLAGAVFNRLRTEVVDLAAFDARVFALPSVTEVYRYLRWRQGDARRNGLFMAASQFYSHKELHGRNAQEKVCMLEQAGSPWESYPDRVKFGAQCEKVYSEEKVTYTRRDTGEAETVMAVRGRWNTKASGNFFLDTPVLGFRE